MDRPVPEQPILDHAGPWSEADCLDLGRDGAAAGRVELVDGALVVGPGVTLGRDRAVERVREAVAAALPDGLRVIGPVPLRLGRDCVLLPDLVVARALPEPDPAGLAAAPATVSPVTSPVAETAAEPGDGAAAPATAGPVAETAAEPGDGAAAPEPGPVAVPAAPDAPAVLDAADALMVLEVVGAEHGAVDRSFKPQLYARSRIPYSLLVDHDAGFAVATMIISGRYHEYAYAAAGEVLRIEEPFPLSLDLSDAEETRTA